jgi:DNA-binding winged helix-turn-helix (wHTH) protein/tetratricopeptide (TPR) repeat protein
VNNLLKQYKFGVFCLDLNLKCLSTKDGQTIDLTPKAMSVLSYLIENRHRVVTKEELLSNVWQEAVVNDSNVHVNISNLRTALGRHGGARFIQTVSTQGYRFAEPVEEQLPEPSKRPRATEGRDVPVGNPERRKSEIPAILRSLLRRRLLLAALAVAVLLAVSFAGFWVYRYRRHSPRYIASKYLADAIRAHNAGHDEDGIGHARDAFLRDPSLVRAYLLAAWWESGNAVDDRTAQAGEILDQLKNGNVVVSATEDALEMGIRADNGGDVAQALEAFNKATLLSPGNADAWGMYGFEAYRNHEFDIAVMAFRKCVSIEPQNTDCVVGQLTTQNELNQFDQSVKLFSSLPESVKETPRVLEMYGYAEMGQKNYQNAIDAFELGIRRAPADESSAINASKKGMFQAKLLRGDDPIDVVSSIEDEIQTYPKQQTADWELYRAAVYAVAGLKSEATNHVSQALTISDNWRKHHRKIDVGLIDDYYAYRLYAICGDFDKAEQGADDFDQQDPELIAVESFIEGMRELASPNMTRDAAMKFQKGYERYPDPLYDYYRGQALLKLGDAAGAKQALRRFLDHRGEFQQNSIGLALLIPRAEKTLAEIKE